jgi:hypothetical protein
MPNFTPGPWNSHKIFYPIDADPNTCTSSTDGNPFDYLTISIAKGDLLIGTAAWNSRGDGWPTASSPEECRANAHLMIAAPDMYAALNDLRIRYIGLFDACARKTYAASSNPDDDLRLALIDTGAALAKAEGKQAQS